MNDFILVVGVLLLALVWWDSFVTVFSMDGAGPVTNFWTRVLWKGLLTLHERISCHWLLSMAGPLILVLTILVWCFAHAVAWTMIFISRPGSVVDDARGLVATPMETLYFVGTTVSSLGYGDFTPAAPPWTWLSNVACFSATIILTVSLSYVLAVLSAALEKHVFAQSVFGLGKDIESFIRNASLGNPNDSLKDYVVRLSSALDAHSHRHLTYPILLFFHSRSLHNSTPRAVLLMSDATFVMSHIPDGDYRPPRGLLRLIDSAIENFRELTDADLGLSVSGDRALEPIEGSARRLGIAVDGPHFQGSAEQYRGRRQELLRLCRQDAWAVIG